MRITRSSRALVATFALTLGITACASGGGGTGGAPRGSSTRIISEELATVAQLDLYTAVSRLRPQWLRPGTRGQLPEVIIDGSRQQGGTDALRNMRANEATELQFMSASDATTRYGTGFTAGAIIVSTRR
jgi:hypothetical protein